MKQLKALIEEAMEGSAEGFFGMLYIPETPLHFGLILISWIILLLSVLVGFSDTSTKKKRVANPWLNFLCFFFLFFTFSILLTMIYQLPATATADQLMPYFMALWSCYAIYGFFVIFYLFSTEFFQAPLWLRYLFFIGTLSFLALLWILATPTTSFLVFDGAMNWLAMPLSLLAYGGFLWIIYLLIFPLFITYRVNKHREHPIKTGNWLIWLGGLIVDIGALLIALILFLAPYVLIALILTAIGMVITLIGGIINYRAKPPPTQP
ncbi:MAG: hypothetical protein ACFFD8_06570 [Candidatus Thorarchaeota archaeon]